MVKKFALNPAHPERNCWGCDRYCAADAMVCGNGSVATPHPAELFGEDWMTWTGTGEEPAPLPAEPPADDNAGP